MQQFRKNRIYFTRTATRKKKRPCKVCLLKFNIVFEQYKTLINNVNIALEFVADGRSKFIDEVIPKHLQPELFTGKQKCIASLKEEWTEVKKQAKAILKAQMKNKCFNDKQHKKTMKQWCSYILNTHNNSVAEQEKIKSQKKKVYHIDGIPIQVKYSEKAQKVVISKTYGSESYTNYEIESIEKNLKTT